jgi:gliding motility-associated-like protein
MVMVDAVGTEPSSSSATNGNVNITVSGGNAPYTYSWSNGASSEDINNLGEGTYSVTVTDQNNCSANASAVLSLGPKISSASVTQIDCNGNNNGAINLTSSGGNGAHSYSWSDGSTSEDLSDLGPGSYSVTVTDGNNETTTGGPYVINEPTSLVVTYEVTEVVTQSDGRINLTVTGGTPSYSYNWSNGASSQDLNNINPGNYSVTVTDANGCERFEDILVQVEELRINYTVMDVTCSGDGNGAIMSSPQNGSAPHTFAWSTGATTPDLIDISGGLFSVTITDATGKEKVDQVEVVEPQELRGDAEVIQPSTATSDDGSAEVFVSGGTPPYQYEWSDIVKTTTAGVNNLGKGDYTCLVTDANGCQIIIEIEVFPAGVQCYDASLVITPNGDGLNDNLFIFCAEDESNVLEIYNKSGQLIFETPNYDNSWSGVDDTNKALPDGVYYWVMKVSFQGGASRLFKGHVTLVKNLDN